MNAVWVALIVGGCGVIGQLLVNYQNARQRSKDRQEDWKRQDEVASKAERAAERLLAQNERVAESTKEAKQVIDEIHILVNSNMSAALQSELDETVRGLAVLRELTGWKDAAGHPPTKATLETIEEMEQKIKDLQVVVADRQDRNRAVEAKEILESFAVHGPKTQGHDE